MSTKKLFEEMGRSLELYGSGPTFQEMNRHSLEVKGMAGSTAAHNIEEIHAPTNFAYTTYTTGTTAFQNIVGVVHQELEPRRKAGRTALEIIGAEAGDKILVTYPPLVNAFSGEPLKVYGLDSCFMLRPNRDAFLYSLYTEQPQLVLGESSFIRAAIEDAGRLGLLEAFPPNLKIIAIGTPLDLALLEQVERLTNAEVFDLYGAQEFGLLTLNGEALRSDIQLLSFNSEPVAHLVVGGLATGDVFQTGKGHILNPKGQVVTYSRVRSSVYWETWVEESTVADLGTLQRLASTILRIKGRVVRISPQIKIGAAQNKLVLRGDGENPIPIPYSENRLFEQLLEAQIDYQGKSKVNAVWNKKN